MKLIQLQVEAVAMDYRGYPVVVLREKGGQRAVFIWIGLVEAGAISMHLEGQRPPRPMTHDLMVSLLTQLGIQVKHVLISDVRDETYFAEMSLTMGDATKAIDCRPSDAIAVAVRVEAPIFIDNELLDRLEDARKDSEDALSSEATFVDSGETTIH
jgi:bifunctional DNase/RNase